MLKLVKNSIANHKNQADALKSDVDTLTNHYNNFLEHLTKLVNAQNGQIKDLGDHLNTQQNEINTLAADLQNTSSQISGLHADVDQANAVDLNAKLENAINTLADVDKQRKESQQKLENVQSNLSSKKKSFMNASGDVNGSIAGQKRLSEVQNLLDRLDKLNRERNEIALQHDKLEARIISDSNKDIIDENLQKELEGLTLKLRWANDEINNTKNDLADLLELIKSKNDFILEQQVQITQLKTEITNIKILIEERIQTITQLEQEIRDSDDEIEKLKAEIDEMNAKVEELQKAIAERDAEIEELNRTLKARLSRINKLQTEIEGGGKKYVAIKGDEVDEMIAKYIQNCPVPVKRLGGGFYLFGLKKIYAKILNGKLVIRVGGGYMVIDKFIETYADQELQKLQRLAEKEGVSSFMDLDLEAISLGPKSPIGRSPTAGSPSKHSNKTSFSSTTKSSTSKASTTINGTKRTVTTTTTTTTKMMGTSKKGTTVVKTETFVKKK